MSPTDSILSRLGKTKKQGKGWIAQCPAHEDSSPSLSISESVEGHALLYCHAGCSVEAICTRLGITPGDLFAKNGTAPPPSKERHYDYVNAKGELIYQVVRGWDEVRQKKTFKQRRPDGTGWAYDLKDVKPLPYKLPRVKEAVKAGKTVFIVEGEKDVEAIESQGGVATCNSGGAGKWSKSFSNGFVGAHVVIVRDKDEPGHNHAEGIARLLRPVAASIEIVEAKEGKDAYDHIAAGHKITEFVRPVPAHLNITWMDTVEVEDVEWLAYPYIALKRCTLLDGDGDMGKSYMTCALAAAISNGRLPFGEGKIEPSNVLMLASEDEASDTIKPRYLKFGGVESRLAHVSDLFPFTTGGLERLEHTMEVVKPLLVVIDPVLSYCGAAVNINQPNEVRPIFDGLRKLASKFRCAILNIRHTAKSSEGRSAGNLGLGSVDIRNAHRSQLVVRWNPDRKGQRIVTHEKHNLSDRGAAFGFEFLNGEFVWAFDIEEPDWASVEKAPKFTQAKNMVEEMLKYGSVESSHIEECAKEHGISIRTLKEVYHVLKIESSRKDGKWYKSLPVGDIDPFGEFA